MLTCKSPRKVMRVAFHLASQTLPQYSCKCSRKDFTLPQLFACLSIKELLKRSYRGAEALLRDSDAWLKEIGLDKAPDHNTLQRAAAFLLRKCNVNKLLDVMARWASMSRLLGLSTKPLAIDSTYYESRHVSRHYERRCRQGRGKNAGKQAQSPRESGRSSTRSKTVQRLPKLAVAVASGADFVLSLWSGTGAGADHGHFEALLLDAWQRVPNRCFKVVADAGYDSEANHRVARQDMGLPSLIPPEIGRRSKSGKPPAGRWRRQMKRQLSTAESRRKSGYTQRWQAETVNSMMKRNLGSALAGKTAHSRKRDLHLKALTHNVMVLKRGSRQSRLAPFFANPSLRSASPAHRQIKLEAPGHRYKEEATAIRVEYDMGIVHHPTSPIWVLAHCQHHPEPDLAAGHSVIGFRDPGQGECFDHGADAFPGAEAERVFGIHCRAGIPALDDALAGDQSQGADVQGVHGAADDHELAAGGEAADERRHRGGIGGRRKDHLSIAPDPRRTSWWVSLARFHTRGNGEAFRGGRSHRSGRGPEQELPARPTTAPEGSGQEAEKSNGGLPLLCNREETCQARDRN
jgi:hypothetical protein